MTQKAKSTPKSKITYTTPKTIGTGKPVTVEIKGKTVVLQPGTEEYEKFVGSTFKKLTKSKNYDANIVKTSSGPKIITVNVPIPPAKTNQVIPGSNTSATQVDSGSVNSKDLALHLVEK